MVLGFCGALWAVAQDQQQFDEHRRCWRCGTWRVAQNQCHFEEPGPQQKQHRRCWRCRLDGRVFCSRTTLTAGLQETFAPGQHRRRRGTGTGVTDAVLIEPKSCQTAAKPWRMRRRGRKNAVRIFGSGGSEKMAWRNQHRRTTSVRELCLALAAGLQETFAPGQHRRRRGTGTGVTDAVLIEPKSCGASGEKMAWRNQNRCIQNRCRQLKVSLMKRRKDARDFSFQDTHSTLGHRHHGHSMLFLIVPKLPWVILP